MPEDVDLIVIGSGQGGMPLAVAFADAGKRVVLFERGRLGGTCVNYGCTPSKAYLAAAHNAGRARAAGPLGIHADVRVDQTAVMTRVRKIRDEWHDGSERRVAKSAIELVRATASFTGERTVSGGGRDYRGALVVIDTGTSPRVPPIDGLAGTPYLTNENWFDQETLPARLAVYRRRLRRSRARARRTTFGLGGNDRSSSRPRSRSRGSGCDGRLADLASERRRNARTRREGKSGILRRPRVHADLQRWPNPRSGRPPRRDGPHAE